jgi:hypothetical protein
VTKVFYWLSARPLFALIGKGYGILRKALENIPGFEAFGTLATTVTDRVFSAVRFPEAIEARFEPYIEFQRGRQMDRAVVFILLIYVALLGAYPSNLGHLDTAPQIWIALPIISGFNPYLGLVSGVVFSVFDWVGKFLPFESVYGADFGDGFQNFWGARVGYILAYTTMILNGMLPGVLARVFRQFIRGIAHKILPRKATQAVMGLLMLLAAGTLLYQIGGPRAVYAMSAFSLMGFAMAMGPPPPGQGSPCMSCGALLPPGQYQCMACGGLTQEGQQYMEQKRHMEEQARRHAQQHPQQHPQPPGGPPIPPTGATPPGGPDYLYEAMATVGSMLGATVGIVASYEWAQQVGNYGAFYALRAEPDVSCRDLSAGNYGELQAQSPIPGAAAGAMPPGAAGAMSPGGNEETSPGPETATESSHWNEHLGEGKPGDSQSAYVPDEDGNLVSRGFIYDPDAGGWREAAAGEPDGHGQVWDPQAGVWQSASFVAADARVRQENQQMRERERAKIDQRRIDAERKMKEAQARRERIANLEKREALRKKVERLQKEADAAQAEATWWDRATAVAEGAKLVIDTTANVVSAAAPPPAGQIFGYTYGTLTGAAEAGSTAYISGESYSNVAQESFLGGAEGATTTYLGGKIGGFFKGGKEFLGKGLTNMAQSITKPISNAFSKGFSRGVVNSVTSAVQRGVNGAIKTFTHSPVVKQIGKEIISGELGAHSSSTLWSTGKKWVSGKGWMPENGRLESQSEAAGSFLSWINPFD